MTAARPSDFVAKPYWPALLIMGLGASAGGGAILGVSIDRSSGWGLIVGIVVLALGGVLLLAGVIGLGVASAGVRPAIDALLDVQPGAQEWIESGS